MLSITTLSVSGCVEVKTNIPPARNAAVIVEYAPADVELGEPKSKFEPPDVVFVEIPYRFTSGHPVAHYRCDVNFPETQQGGLKLMEAWELKDEGTIKTAFNVTKDPGKVIEVELSEAESPDKGFKSISNKSDSPREEPSEVIEK